MFEFDDDHPLINVSLQVIKTKIFEDIPMLMTNFYQSSATIQHWMECYNVTGKPNDDEPCDIKIPEFEDTHMVEGSGVSSDMFPNPLKIKKVNIGSSENSKFANIRDYWDDKNVKNIIDLLHELQDLFPTNFFEVKGIVGDLGEMKIPLRPNANLVKQ